MVPVRIDRPSGGGSDRPDDPDPPHRDRPRPDQGGRDHDLRDPNGQNPAEYIAAWNKKVEAEQAAAEKGNGADEPPRRDPVMRDANGLTAAELRFQRNKKIEEAEAEEAERDERARDQLDRLPVREPGDKTRGLWTDQDGTEHELISGRDQYTPKVDEVADEKKIGPDPYRLGVAKHVETKFAVLMRERGLTDESITVNNRPCPGELGCDETLPLFLPARSSLTVYAPDDFKKTYRSTETDQEGPRS